MERIEPRDHRGRLSHTPAKSDELSGEPSRPSGWHARAVELIGLLSSAVRLQREPCLHLGIGRPGCGACDPRVRDALRLDQEPDPVLANDLARLLEAAE